MFSSVAPSRVPPVSRNDDATPFEQSDDEIDSDDEAEWLPNQASASSAPSTFSASAAAAASSPVSSSSSSPPSASLSSRPQRQEAFRVANCLRIVRAFDNMSEDEQDSFEDWVDSSAISVTESESESVLSPNSSSAPASGPAQIVLPHEPESVTSAFFEVGRCDFGHDGCLVVN